MLQLPSFFLVMVLFVSVISGRVNPPHYPGQKYLLSKKFPDGTIRKVKVYDYPATMEQVLGEHGPCYYILRMTKPRFSTVWKGWVGKADQEGDLLNSTNPKIAKLERQTKYLGVGLIGSFGTQALGFGLSHLRFSKIEDRISRLETAMRSFPVQGLQCAGCQTPITNMLQEFCARCGSPIEWPKDSPTKSVTSSRRWSLP